MHDVHLHKKRELSNNENNRKTFIEKNIEYNKPIVLAFVDFCKALNTVNISAI